MLPFYELVIDDSEDTGVDFNAFVLRPAHGKPYFAFNKEQKIQYFFNEEKRIVTGVMMSANTPIYRSNPDRFVLFKEETIKAIRTKFHKNGFSNNVNEEHNPDLKLDGVNMISSYIVSHPNHIPSQFKAMNLQNGTWIASYKIDNPTVWNKIKKGQFSGYSVEGYFDQKEIKLKTNK
jgi:hypothetical protein